MLGAYQKQTLSYGWTRAETLVQIYDRAIQAIQGCKESAEANDEIAFGGHIVKVHKTVVAIHAGLKADEDEVAFNVARLLHFITVLVEGQKWDEAISLLSQLRDSFAAIVDEANQLERDGVIPPMRQSDSYESIA